MTARAVTAARPSREKRSAAVAAAAGPGERLAHARQSASGTRPPAQTPPARRWSPSSPTASGAPLGGGAGPPARRGRGSPPTGRDAWRRSASRSRSPPRPPGGAAPPGGPGARSGRARPSRSACRAGRRRIAGPLQALPEADPVATPTWRQRSRTPAPSVTDERAACRRASEAGIELAKPRPAPPPAARGRGAHDQHEAREDADQRDGAGRVEPADGDADDLHPDAIRPRGRPRRGRGDAGRGSSSRGLRPVVASGSPGGPPGGPARRMPMPPDSTATTAPAHQEPRHPAEAPPGGTPGTP